MLRRRIVPLDSTSEDLPVYNILVTNELDQTYFGCNTWRLFGQREGVSGWLGTSMYLHEVDRPRIDVAYNGS
jgi:hypothetical protein